MKVLVTFAVDTEFAPWRQLRKFAKQNHEPSEYFAARIADAEVNVLLTGIGGKNAWLETTKMVWDGTVDICISSGLAGALRGEYRPGDILAARRVHARVGKGVLMSDARLVQLAVEYGARAVDCFYTADRVIGLASEKRELANIADAVEMESGEVLYEASAFGAKAVAIRGISDAAEEDLPLNFNRTITPTGAVSVPRVLGETLRHPGAAPALMRFAKQSRMAAERLCGFLDRYLEGVASSVRMGSATRP